MIDGIGKLRIRLKNWGCWLNYDADIAPHDAMCISLESRYQPDAGEVWGDETIVPALPEPEPDEIHLTPNVADAEAMNAMIRELDHILQYSLAVTYGGAPTVMRWRRVGDHVIARSLDMAELLLCEALKKSA